MASERLTVLLIEDSPGYIRLIYELLREAHSSEFNFESAETLAEGVARLARGGVDAVLLDLTLPDSRGQQTITQVRRFAPAMPIVVLTDMNDEELAVRAVKLGAQDYLLKSQVDGNVLARSIRYAIERKQVEEALRNSQEELRRLAEHLQTAREDERMHVARELHDELSQQLAAAKIDAFQLAKSIADDTLPLNEQRATILDKLDSYIKIIDSSIRSIRTLVTELRPNLLEDFGLEAAIEWQVQQFQERTGIECRFITQSEETEWDRERSVAIFRIVQEALNNVARHSHASHVDVIYHVDDHHLTLEIRDDGLGISPADLQKANHFGILGMRERIMMLGGEINIDSEPGRGTHITVRAPLQLSTHPVPEG